MKSEQVAGIRPEVIVWARESVGMTVEDVAHKLKRPRQEIEAWERGEASPTYPQLEKLAYDLYKRPLAVFFLPAAPEEVQPRHEFRTLPDTDLDSLQKDTYLHIRRAHAYQLALKDLFGERNPLGPGIWQTIKLSIDQSVSRQAQAIREYLGITLQMQRDWRDDDTALKQWRSAIEKAGVFVFKASFKQREISGFCLMDANLPVIYLNNGTTKTRQTFSLLHELAHLLLSISGLSKLDKQYIDFLPQAEQNIERFCNAVAAEILIPSHDFSQQAASFPTNVETASEELIANLASRYGVSREAILRRFLDLGRVSRYYYELKSREWTAQMKKAGGGSWYSNQTTYLSDYFTREVVARHFQHQISLEQAADFLGVKPKNYYGLEERILRGASA